MKKKTKGFTLIEMCLVIAIIAILILLIVPNITQQKQKAEQKNRRSISDDFTDTIRTTK
ncbi:prepilin-type N-terminal cleavage/methylation domain-containing protein [Holzapfeliella floricola]|uniref:prepilin-type N-terminal cleavage/methylation domain-containing protein n=1 Tax=Holzapfeliella floricola TaxID=679249 RepID=UPI003F723C64